MSMASDQLTRRNLHCPPESLGRPSHSEVEAAFRTIIRWAGDNPHRDGLVETPARMARAYEEYFKGYAEDPEAILSKTFEEIEGYDEMIVLRGIRFETHCEHHMAPIIGRAWVLHCRVLIGSGSHQVNAEDHWSSLANSSEQPFVLASPQGRF